MKALIVVVAILQCGLAAAGNYAECLLEKMPDVKSDAMRYAVMRTCATEFSGRLSSVERGAGRGLFGFKSGDACVLKKAANIGYQPAASAIAVACRCLYDEPAPPYVWDDVPRNSAGAEVCARPN